MAVAALSGRSAAAAAAELYWDVNGSGAGGANASVAHGTWGANNFWSTDAAGNVATGPWVAGGIAVFSAGANVVGASSVGVSGTQTAAGLTFEEGAVTLQGSGTIVLAGDGGGGGGDAPVVTIGAGTLARAAMINAALSAAVPVEVVRGTSGAASLSLGGSNAFGGGLRVGGGVRVDANSAAALGGSGAGAGAVTVTGTEAAFCSNSGSATTISRIEVHNDFLLNPAGAAGFVTAFASAGHAMGTNHLTFGGDISGNADVYITATPAAGATTASGSGMTVFAGSNTYAGRTVVNVAEGGSFQLASAGALPAGTALVFGRGQADGQAVGAVDLAGHDISVASLASDAGGSRVHGIANSSAAAGGGITITGAAATTFAGAIGATGTVSMHRFGFVGTGNLSLTLAATHAGSLTLTAASTYTGLTRVDGGRLVVAHTASAADTIAGDVVVNAGGRLASAGGGGASAGVGGQVTINDGAALEPGGAGATGTLRIAGGLAINSNTASTGGLLRFDLDGPDSHDRIDLGAAALTLDDGFHPVEITGTASPGTYTLINYGSRTWDGQHGFTTTLDPGGGFSYALDFTDTALRLVVSGGGGGTQSLAWDVGGGGAPIADGGGTWADGSGNFCDVATGAAATFTGTADAHVSFGSDATAAGGTVALGGDVRTGGMLTFGPIDPAAPYTIDGGTNAYTLTTAGGITANSGATINAAVVLEGAQTWQVADGRTLAVGGNVSGAFSLTKAGGGTLQLGGTNNLGGLHVAAGAVALTSGTTRVGTLALAAGGTLDIRSNKLVVTTGSVGTATTASGNGRTYDGLQGEVQRAKNGDAWDGNGLTSSIVATEGGLTTIGIATGAQAKGGIGATETAVWGGQTITGSSILAMYTYAGDANLDGAITGDDYSAIDFGILFEGMDGYANGDFNYDGYVTGDDYSVIDLNILLQGPQIPTGGSVSASSAGLAGVTAVPEPSACGFAVLAAAAARRRRQRASSRG